MGGTANFSDIVSNQTTGAAAPPAPSAAQSVSSAHGTANLDDIASNQTTAAAASAPPTASGMFNFPKHIPTPPVDPPQDSKEEFVKSVSGNFGLSTYRQARATVEKVEGLLKSPSTAYEAGKQSFMDHLKTAYAPEGYSGDMAQHVVRGEPLIPPPAGFGAALGTVAAEAAPGVAAANASLQSAQALQASAAARAGRANPWLAKIMQGKRVALPAAEDAIRSGVEAGTADPALAANVRNAPIGSANDTILKEPLTDLATKTKAAYKQIDDAAGFDLKDAKLRLSNDQYNLKQLGNTPADQAARKTLQESITDSTQRITDAETKLAKANIDPKAGDALNTRLMAGTDIKNLLVRTTAKDGTVNVDQMLTGLRKLRDTENGDRVLQFTQSNAAADHLINELQAAQKAGVSAMKWQKLAKWIGGVAVTAAVGGTTAGEVYSHITAP